eukprot:13184306-Alexandrium_andersonii.AAC.1
MSASLVGSEMCIRDSPPPAPSEPPPSGPCAVVANDRGKTPRRGGVRGGCLLYTSDAADDM